MAQVKAEIDVAHGADTLIEEAAETGVTATLVKEVGPAGGHPVFWLVGEREDVEAFLTKEGYEPEEHIRPVAA